MSNNYKYQVIITEKYCNAIETMSYGYDNISLKMINKIRGAIDTLSTVLIFEYMDIGIFRELYVIKHVYTPNEIIAIWELRNK